MMRWFLLLVSILLLCPTQRVEGLTEAEEDDDLDFYLGKLYEENGNDLDPHDMLPGLKRHPIKEVKHNMFEEGLDTNTCNKGVDKCSFEKLKWNEESQRLTKCQEELRILEKDANNVKQKMKALEKKMLNEGSVDAMAFYLRLVYHFQNILKLKEAEQILQDPSEAIIKHVAVRLSKDDIITLQKLLDHQTGIQQVDEILHDALKLEDVDDHSKWNFNSILEGAISVFEIGKNVEIWLYVLCTGFLVLAVWAIYLFIKDIQQELRWMRVMMMMIVLLFFICCMWHWRHMHKVAESRRHARMMKQGFNNIPEECKPGANAAAYSAWEWIKVRVFGAPDICEKYFEEMMIDPSEEITPAMVIAETLAKFVLQPLQHLGSESAKFITNFYQNVPVVYHVPATIFFVVLLIIILFAFCGYGIDFPLWMGGIRPIYRTKTADTTDVDRIAKEAIAQLKSDREKFMTESRMMLTDIAQAAAAASQAQVGVNPLVMMSSSILETQLENLIARQISGAISKASKNDTSFDSGNAGQFSGMHQSEDNVYTVTSTPLRKHIDFKRFDSSSTIEQDVRDGGKEKLVKPNDEVGTMVATTDAVHYRLKGSNRKGDIAPRETGPSSPSPSVSHSPKAPKSKGVTKNGRDFETTCSPELSINRSLNDLSSDESGENFYHKVRSILEESANSSMNVENSNVSYGTDARSLSVNEGRSRTDEEIELSTSGARFLSKIKKVLTP